MPDKTRDWVAWILIIGIIAFSVIRTQTLNNEVGDVAETNSDLVLQMALQQQCTENFLAATVESLGERTQTAPELNNAERDRLLSQGRLIGFLVRANQDPDSATLDEYGRVLNDYFTKLSEHLEILSQTDRNQRLNPYPTKDDYRTCLRGGQDVEAQP